MSTNLSRLLAMLFLAGLLASSLEGCEICEDEEPCVDATVGTGDGGCGSQEKQLSNNLLCPDPPKPYCQSAYGVACPGHSYDLLTEAGRHEVVSTIEPVDLAIIDEQRQIACGCSNQVLTYEASRVPIEGRHRRCDNIQDECADPVVRFGTVETRASRITNYSRLDETISLADGCIAGEGWEPLDICRLRVRKVFTPEPNTGRPDFSAECSRNIRECMFVTLQHIHPDAALEQVLHGDNWNLDTHDIEQVRADTLALRDAGDAWPTMTACIRRAVLKYQSPRSSSVNDNDHDTVCAILDNCGGVPNPDQADFDEDGQGDACDTDDDNDDVLDTDEIAAGMNPKDQDSDDDGIEDGAEYGNGPPALDTDGDGTPDALDLDSDGDALPDAEEPGDEDEDGVPDSRQPDRDGDGIGDSTDNCRNLANAEQHDLNEDGEGDACDTDDDSDGIADELDNCALFTNPTQLDSNQNGFGDPCEPQVVIATCQTGQTSGTCTLDNEYTFSSQAAGVLSIPVEITLKFSGAVLDAERHSVEVCIDSAGGSTIEWDDGSNVTVGRCSTVAGASLNQSERKYSAEVKYSGLPELNLDFGLKLLRACLLDGQTEVRCEERELEIFWPMFANPTIVVAASDQDYATNHGGGDVCKDPNPCVAPANPYNTNYVFSRPAGDQTPNWFHYWKQVEVDGHSYFSDTTLYYMHGGFGADFGSQSKISGVTPVNACWPEDNIPYNEIWIFGPAAIEQSQARICVKGQICPTFSGIEAFHLVWRHEAEHASHGVLWTWQAQGILLDHDAIGSKYDWSHRGNRGSRYWNNFWDLNGNSHDDHNPPLNVDFDGNGQISRAGILESEMVIDYLGEWSGIVGLDVNRDGMLDYLFKEYDAECFDHDQDHVPVWDDLDDNSPKIFGEELCEWAERSFIPHLAEISLQDWGNPGKNYDGTVRSQ